MALAHLDSKEAGRVSVPREVREWQEAERVRIAAVATYNARVEYARSHDLGTVSCDPEYQEMCRTQKVASSLLKPMYEALSAAPAPAATKGTGWISVKDQLPGAELEWVLVAAEFDGPSDWRIKLGALDSECSTGWKVLGGSWVPTHWMPLPAAPSPDAQSGSPDASGTR